MCHKWKSHDVWFLRYGARQTDVFVILGHFLPFTQLTTWKNQNFENMKKTGISSFYTCERQMKIIWCMVPETWSTTDNFLTFYPHPPNNVENQKLEKMPGDTIILHLCSKTHNHMLYCSWDMARDGCNFYFSFWDIFCPFTKQPKKSKFWEHEKNACRYHHFTHVYQKLWSHNVHFLWNGVRQMNGWTEKVT